MKRKEKVVEREGREKEEDAELKGKIKLKTRMILEVGKRAGPSTPSPTWRLEFSSLNENNQGNPIQEFLNTTTSVSARKLCASLWETQPQPHLSVSKMSKNVGARGTRHGLHRDKKSFELRNRSVDPPDQQASASNLRKTAAKQPRQSVEMNAHAVRPLSPASHGGSTEMAPYRREMTATRFLDFKSRRGQSNYSLKTSTKILKVLNRIWNLEEQQSSNLSLLKALTMELDHSRSQIKLLLKEKEANRREMDDLIKQVAEDKAVRKTKEQDRIKAAIQYIQQELDDERKLRKHSESLQTKLARELSEVKSSFSNALKDLERERKARTLLENLCDEFANGIRDYEQEVRSLRHKPEMDDIGRGKSVRLILHISEAWLDERMQMKIAEVGNDLEEKKTIVDKLSLDIETFLQARQSVGKRRDEKLMVNEEVNNRSRRESFPLNEVVSAPGVSTDNDSYCFELNKSRQSIGRRVDNASERNFREMVNLSRNSKVGNLQLQCEGGERGEKQVPGMTDVYEYETSQERKSGGGFNSSHVLQHLIRNHSLSSEGDKIHPQEDFKEDTRVQPAFRSHAGPVQQWKSKLTSPKLESLRLASGLKENTLKAKLLEARYQAKASKSSF